jgi:hypothetical protein
MQQQRSNPILVFRVESLDPNLVEEALDWLRNNYTPNCSTSRLIKNSEKQSWHAFLNVYKLIDKGPRVIHWNPNNMKQESNQDTDQCAENKEVAQR